MGADPVDLDDILAEGYLDALQTRPMDELRRLRAECEEIEVGLSYARRMVQGSLDIVNRERRRRADGGAPGDLAALVEELPDILADRVVSSGRGAMPSLMAPSARVEGLVAEIDEILSVKHLGDLSDRSDAEVDAIAERLAVLERSISERRKAVHEPIDAVGAEITRRYRTGEASVEELL